MKSQMFKGTKNKSNINKRLIPLGRHWVLNLNSVQYFSLRKTYIQPKKGQR